jgi:biotin carboxyl carrier protein
LIYHVTVGERTFVVDLGGGKPSVDGREVDADLEHVEGSPVRSLLLDGRSHRLAARRVGRESWVLHIRGRRIRAEVVDERTRVIREMAGAGSGPSGPSPIVAPMPGLVMRVGVEEGQTVRAGQGLVIVEAMKMENELSTAVDAVVTRIHVAEGQAVEKDQLLVELAAPEPASDVEGPTTGEESADD